jgi:hypothetical protein
VNETDENVQIYKINSTNAYEMVYSSNSAVRDAAMGNGFVYYIVSGANMLYKISTANYALVGTYAFGSNKQPTKLMIVNNTLVVYVYLSSTGNSGNLVLLRDDLTLL